MESTLRQRVGAWVDHPRQQRFIIGLILFNAGTLGLETSPTIMSQFGHLMHIVDQAILAQLAELRAQLAQAGAPERVS